MTSTQAERRAAEKQAAVDQAFRNLQAELNDVQIRLKNSTAAAARGDARHARSIEPLTARLANVKTRIAAHLQRFPSSQPSV